MGSEVLFTGDPSHSFACSCSSAIAKAFAMMFSMELRGKCNACLPLLLHSALHPHRQKGRGQHAQITLCEFGLGGAFYRRSLTLVCVFTFKCDCQDLCNDVFSGVVRKMQRLLAIAAALCAVTVSSHRQKGWGQHAQITLRRAESFFNL